MEGNEQCPGVDSAVVLVDPVVESHGDGLPERDRPDVEERDRDEQRPERFQVGQKFDAMVTGFDRSKKPNFSIKAYQIAEEKQAVREYGSSDSGASLGDILGQALKEAQSAKKAPKQAEKAEKAAGKKAGGPTSDPSSAPKKLANATRKRHFAPFPSSRVISAHISTASLLRVAGSSRHILCFCAFTSFDVRQSSLL